MCRNDTILEILDEITETILPVSFCLYLIVVIRHLKISM